MVTRNKFSDGVLFFRAWLTRPLQTAAFFPSSRGLAEAIVEEVPAGRTRVLELGPGTGVFTEALLRRGIEESDLVLVESNPRFAELLAARYPLATLVHADAAEIGRRLPDSGRPFGAAVSGLPLLSMPKAKVTEILSAAFAYMAPDAGLFQFTYSSRCPVRKQLLDALGLEGIPRRRVLANVWPARVYRIARKPARFRNLTAAAAPQDCIVRRV